MHERSLGNGVEQTGGRLDALSWVALILVFSMGWGQRARKALVKGPEGLVNLLAVKRETRPVWQNAPTPFACAEWFVCCELFSIRLWDCRLDARALRAFRREKCIFAQRFFGKVTADLRAADDFSGLAGQTQ